MRSWSLSPGMYRQKNVISPTRRRLRFPIEARKASTSRLAAAAMVSLGFRAFPFRRSLMVARAWRWVVFVLKNRQSQLVAVTFEARVSSRFA